AFSCVPASAWLPHRRRTRLFPTGQHRASGQDPRRLTSSESDPTVTQKRPSQDTRALSVRVQSIRRGWSHETPAARPNVHLAPSAIMRRIRRGVADYEASPKIFNDTAE